jgi:hypothetical protein
LISTHRDARVLVGLPMLGASSLNQDSNDWRIT